MHCEFCGGTGRVARLRHDSTIDIVTCPRCIRGVSVLGTHEMLRGADGIHKPGENIAGPTGTIIDGLIGAP